MVSPRFAQSQTNPPTLTHVEVLLRFTRSHSDLFRSMPSLRNSCSLMQFYSGSPNFIQIQPLSVRYPARPAELFRFTQPSSTSFRFTQVPSEILTPTLIHNVMFLFRFTQTHSDLLRLVQALSDGFRFAQSLSYSCTQKEKGVPQGKKM